jgi:hypothetical protein
MAPNEAPVVAETKEVRAARVAVEEFTRHYALLVQMKKEWEQSFPEANDALLEIRQQEDLVQDAIKKAKPLVALAKMTIKDFIVQRKWEKPHYDDEELTRILSSLENCGDVFATLMQNGLITSVSLQKDAAIAWFAQNPEYGKVFESAFRDEKEMTPAVTVPKV